MIEVSSRQQLFLSFRDLQHLLPVLDFSFDGFCLVVFADQKDGWSPAAAEVGASKLDLFTTLLHGNGEAKNFKLA